jgi:hypothetical protein
MKSETFWKSFCSGNRTGIHRLSSVPIIVFCFDQDSFYKKKCHGANPQKSKDLVFVKESTTANCKSTKIQRLVFVKESTTANCKVECLVDCFGGEIHTQKKLH